MSKRVAQKRKLDAVSDENQMSPPSVPRKKKNTGITDVSNIRTSGSGTPQSITGPLSIRIIFEKVQENEALHMYYYKELTNIYEMVRRWSCFMHDLHFAN